MNLTVSEKALLRRLMTRGDQKWVTMNRAVFDGLQALGYAKRTWANGYRTRVRVTQRGVLAALSYGIIEYHPEDPEPVAAMLKKDRISEAINR